ncbi:MAG: biotin--[acetyl-CoA-carboxylase] ligase [Synergistaceae bacterium]|jgi:BirA family biotin operon repressor/biotin-[acetyl-CoA-carboxylase] ligase|nr:biotin--[acetyl-CoA-carboxylase] ligase [Synergistaceae bacterium]
MLRPNEKYEPTDWSETMKFLSGTLPEITINSEPEMSSTQTVAKDAARNGRPRWSVYVTDFQSAGRGRRDRSWQSVPGRDLTFSVILRPDVEAKYAQLLGLVASLSVSRTIRRISRDIADEVSIKWPNDVLIGGRKVCGIICEISGRDAAIDYAVLGIGVNVNRTLDELPRLDSPDRPNATSLLVESGRRFGLPSLLGGILTELSGMSGLITTDENRRLFIAEYEPNCGTIGKRVKIVTDDGGFEGTASGITRDGALIVRNEAEERVFYVGDVVHARL